MKRTWRRLLVVTVAGVAVFAGFSIYADVSDLSARLRGFAWWTFAAALALALTNYAVRYVRWSLYLGVRGFDVPPRISSLTFLSGFALSITPGKLGELVKSFLLRATCQIPVARSAPVVVAERVTDLLALLILGVAGVAVYGIGGTMVLAGGAVVAALLVGLSWPALAHAVIRLIGRIPRLSKLSHRLYEFYDGLADLIRPDRLAWATALGMVAWMAECLGFALIISGFPGTDVPVGLATLIYASTTVAGALSFLPGGLLVTEAGMTLLLVEASRGVDQPTAVAATILTRLATLWFAVVIGLAALAVLRRVAPAASDAMSDEPESVPEPADSAPQPGDGAD